MDGARHILETGAGHSPAQAAAEEEAALLAAFANGDRDAARDLTGRIAPRVFRMAVRMLSDRAEAEDITQETMLRLWRIAPRWQSGDAQVSTWVYMVAMNLCRDRLRRRRGGTVDLDAIPEPEDGAVSAATLIQQESRAHALQQALGTLPDRQRQAIILRHLEDLPNPEIARIMDISVEAVESLTARGKRALTAALGGRKDELGFGDD